MNYILLYFFLTNVFISIYSNLWTQSLIQFSYSWSFRFWRFFERNWIQHSSLIPPLKRRVFIFLIFYAMNTDNFEMNEDNDTAWVRIVSWKITSLFVSKLNSSFTVEDIDGTEEIINCTRIPHMMKNISEWVRVIVHQTASGPKTIETYPSIQDPASQSSAKKAAEMIARAASHDKKAPILSDAKALLPTLP